MPAQSAFSAAARAYIADHVLLGAVVLALGLRVWGLAYGLPAVYNPDEVAILSRALSLAERGLHPGNFVYPSLFFYVLAAAVAAWYGGLRITNQIGSVEELQRWFFTDPSALYLVGRSVSVAAGVAAVVATYALGRRIGGPRVARGAAVLLAVAYYPVRDAHMIKHDVLATFLFLCCVLASYRAMDRKQLSAHALAAAIGGTTFALHYYAIAALAPLGIAGTLSGGGRRVVTIRLLTIAISFGLAFLTFSPFVLLDASTALSDISANRVIIVDRARAQFGIGGAGLEQLRLMVTQGAGFLMSAAAVAGGVALARSRERSALLFFSFPVAFAVLLSQTWPYGRLQNALYPFIAVLAAVGLQAIATRRPSSRLAFVGLVAAAAMQPLWQDVLLARHLTQADTRTLAARWIESHVNDGAGVAVQPYSVQLEPTRASLLEAGAEPTPSPREHTGARIRGLLARDPYPLPAYRLLFIGDNEVDRDRQYIAPERILAGRGAQALREAGIGYVVLRFEAAGESSPIRDHLAANAQLIHRQSPFAGEPVSGQLAFLVDRDIRPSLATERAGPIIEIWRIASTERGPG